MNGSDQQRAPSHMLCKWCSQWQGHGEVPSCCVTGIYQLSFPRLCVFGGLLGRMPAMATGLSPPSKHRSPSAKLGRNGLGYQELWGKATEDDSSLAFCINRSHPSVVYRGKISLIMSMYFPCFGESRKNGLCFLESTRASTSEPSRA